MDSESTRCGRELLAVGRLATDRELRLLFLFYVTLPLTGFLVGRDYWGFMVVPFSILWAGEAVVMTAHAARERAALAGRAG